MQLHQVSDDLMMPRSECDCFLLIHLMKSLVWNLRADRVHTEWKTDKNLFYLTSPKYNVDLELDDLYWIFDTSPIDASVDRDTNRIHLL